MIGDGTSQVATNIIGIDLICGNVIYESIFYSIYFSWDKNWGIRKFEVIMSKTSEAMLWDEALNKSKLKSPAIKMFLF